MARARVHFKQDPNGDWRTSDLQASAEDVREAFAPSTVAEFGWPAFEVEGIGLVAYNPDTIAAIGVVPEAPVLSAVGPEIHGVDSPPKKAKRAKASR